MSSHEGDAARVQIAGARSDLDAWGVMKITVLFFASLREALGSEREVLEVPAQVATVSALRSWLAERGGVWADALGPGRAVRAALDQAMAQGDALLHEGAEVAFFPPVTGG